MRPDGGHVVTSVQDDKTYRFIRVTGPLSDKQYEAITRIEPRPDTVHENLGAARQIAPPKPKME
jgi:hypothetical protein